MDISQSRLNDLLLLKWNLGFADYRQESIDHSNLNPFSLNSFMQASTTSGS